MPVAGKCAGLMQKCYYASLSSSVWLLLFLMIIFIINLIMGGWRLGVDGGWEDGGWGAYRLVNLDFQGAAPVYMLATWGVAWPRGKLAHHFIFHAYIHVLLFSIMFYFFIATYY